MCTVCLECLCNKLVNGIASRSASMQCVFTTRREPISTCIAALHFHSTNIADDNCTHALHLVSGKVSG